VFFSLLGGVGQGTGMRYDGVSPAKRQLSKIYFMEGEMEIQGTLFFRGVGGDDMMEFIEEHREKIVTICTSPFSAASIFIGDVYVEYRPDVGDFDCYVPMTHTIDYGGE
jgi:hypothetical protein